MKTIIPAEALAQHTAILGKTGSGKTSTAKLAIEQVFAEGARVCVLDPIKSDWWGLTSSADGKKPGLAFDILGGPRGHVALHSSAGKAIGELVATGALPHSIIDMADFEPGGQARFFVDFAPTLLRRMRGVLYLVIEEAHLFAPKERSGIGAESMAIHWAKTLATAGRSKGIRLMLLSQRTQALHNALLGSCDTLIAHRFTAPADQEPVNKWLKANVTADIAREVAESLSSLKTGEAWMCAGEAKLFGRRQFPRIHTFDNTATPTGDGDVQDVKQAPVDQAKLRAIIGDAVAEAEANDPKLLRVRISDLERELKKGHAGGQPDMAALREAENVAFAKGRADGFEAGWREARTQTLHDFDQLAKHCEAQIGEAHTILQGFTTSARRARENENGAAVAQRAREFAATPAATVVFPTTRVQAERIGRSHVAQRPPPRQASSGSSKRAGPPQRVLDALAWWESIGVSAPDKGQIGFIAGYRVGKNVGGTFGNVLGALRSDGLIEYPSQGAATLTDAGRKVARPPADAPTTAELHRAIFDRLDGPETRVLESLIKEHPAALTKPECGARAGYTVGDNVGGTFGNILGRLRSLGLIDYPAPGKVVALPVLFLENR